MCVLFISLEVLCFPISRDIGFSNTFFVDAVDTLIERMLCAFMKNKFFEAKVKLLRMLFIRGKSQIFVSKYSLFVDNDDNFLIIFRN